jgi:hypothetical protein
MFCASVWSQGIICMCVCARWTLAHSTTVWFLSSGSSVPKCVSCLRTPYLFHDVPCCTLYVISHPWLWMALWCPMLHTAISFSEVQCFCSVNL